MLNMKSFNNYSSLSPTELEALLSYLKQEEQRIKDNIKVLEVQILDKRKEIAKLEYQEEEKKEYGYVMITPLRIQGQESGQEQEEKNKQVKTEKVNIKKPS